MTSWNVLSVLNRPSEPRSRKEKTFLSSLRHNCFGFLLPIAQNSPNCGECGRHSLAYIQTLFMVVFYYNLGITSKKNKVTSSAF